MRDRIIIVYETGNVRQLVEKLTRVLAVAVLALDSPLPEPPQMKADLSALTRVQQTASTDYNAQGDKLAECYYQDWYHAERRALRERIRAYMDWHAFEARRLRGLPDNRRRIQIWEYG